ncbi:MAG TPA: FAD-binding protein [Myxococcales bacterium]|nr:FAD-binding protein [Myxococcales bacterium]
MSKKSNLPSRRKFLTGAGVTAAAVACAGSAGKDGIDGINGTNGANGKDGVPGVDGVNGTNGQNCTNAPNGLNSIPTSWDYTADVVVIGSGAAGMVAALAAQSKGASVLVVEANYDVGGHCITSGGMVDLGGGTGWQTNAGVVTPGTGLPDSPDTVFQDLVFPASYKPAGATGYFPGLLWGSYAGPYQERAFVRTYADNNVAAEKFLRDNGIVWKKTAAGTAIVDTSHWTPTSKTPRTHTPVWKGQSSNPAGVDAPAGAGGTGYIRPLEATARAKGIKFLLNYRVNAIHRDAVFSGSVRGVTAAYTGGVIPPGTTTPLKPYNETAMGASDGIVPNTGNIHETTASLNIKANKGVFVATGGASSNVVLRRVYDGRFGIEHQVAGEPYSYQTGDGILLSQKCGASLWALGNETSGEDQGTGGAEITKPGSIGCRYGYQNLKWNNASPVFGLAVASGLSGISFNNSIIHVNMAGQRFVDETAGGYTWIDAALQPNAASVPPTYSSGPVWAIFDENTRIAQNWVVAAPWPTTGQTVDPQFFFSAADIPSLVAKINTCPYQFGPMNAATLQATITKYNGFVTAKADTDFGRVINAAAQTIATGPFYAAFSSPVIHDWLTGVRIDEGARVLDLDGKIIPGLYAAGEDVGGMVMHGLAKCAVFGMIGGYNAASGT